MPSKNMCWKAKPSLQMIYLLSYKPTLRLAALVQRVKPRRLGSGYMGEMNAHLAVLHHLQFGISLHLIVKAYGQQHILKTIKAGCMQMAMGL